MKTIGAAKFKEHCLAILNELEEDGLVITKHGKPVARLTPIRSAPTDLIGSMAGEIEIRGDILGTGLHWDSDAES